MESLASLLGKANGGPIEYNGKKVSSGNTLQIRKGDEFELEFLSWNTSFEQGIKLSVDRIKGSVLLNEQLYEKKVLLLWIKGAPKVIRFTCFTKKEQGVLTLQNLWNVQGMTMYGDGNAGLYFDDINETTREYHCSCGYPGSPVNFDDLVFSLRKIEK